MSSELDYFGLQAREEGGPARDGRGRPMLVPRGAPAGQRAAYRRASSFADSVVDKIGIHKWEMRYLARGLAENDDLRMLAAGEIYTSNKLADDVGANRSSGKRLDAVIFRALDRMGIHYLADRGTAIHSFFDLNNFNSVPEELKLSISGYHQKRADEGIVEMASEQFCANDEVMAAGSFDTVDSHPAYGAVVGDGKTGDLSVGYVIQTSIYGNAELYNPDTDERAPIESITGGLVLNREIALLYDVKDEGTTIHTVDLVKGWELTKAIYLINNDLKMDLINKEEGLTPETIGDKIDKTKNRAELTALWSATKDQWNAGHKQHAAAHVKKMED